MKVIINNTSTMLPLAIFAAVGTTSAFLHQQPVRTSSVRVREATASVDDNAALSSKVDPKAGLKDLAQRLNPIVGFYDPLNLSDAEFFDFTNEETIGFLRHAEIKHGRVAMFAFVGYLVHANGIKFPWPMMMDGTPFPSNTNPPELWDEIPDGAKWQIFGLIFFLELWSEIGTPENPHYMKGGKPGAFPDFDVVPLPHPVPFKSLYDPFGLSRNKSAEKKKRGLEVELNNGRLAMLGIFGFLSAQTIPGSVPLLKDVVQPYSGEVMAPFTQNMLAFGTDVASSSV